MRRVPKRRPSLSNDGTRVWPKGYDTREMLGKILTSNSQLPIPKVRVTRALGAAIAIACIGSWALGVGSWALRAAQLQSADQVSFRIIVVSSADRAAQIVDRLKQGADFATLAQSESLDPSAKQGGLIGPIALSELRSDLQAALRALAPGGMSGVLQLPTGFALVKREESAAGSRIRGSEVLAVSAASSVKS